MSAKTVNSIFFIGGVFFFPSFYLACIVKNSKLGAVWLSGWNKDATFSKVLHQLLDKRLICALKKTQHKVKAYCINVYVLIINP